MAVCHNCGGHNSERDDARGETVCTDCGAVLVASAMVDQLSFHSGGRMAGQFIDAATGNTRGFASMYGNRESRELSLARGFDNLERVANKLCLDNRLTESAKLVYRLALSRGFTQGRPNGFVVSACLYAICRKQQAAQMLIDFSDALLVPVKPLAQVFMKLIRTLRLSIPTIDPSLFMERFAAEMDLGEKSKLIAGTGVRLVQAMARDWIVTGRRPLGLCAAGLLIAARYHGISLNSEEIDHIFRISNSTIEKRIQEWSHTPTARLAVKDFETTDLLSLPAMEQPPCVLQRKRRKLALTNGQSTDEAAKYKAPWALEDSDMGEEQVVVGAENLPMLLTTAPLETSLAGKLPLSEDIQKLCGTNVAPSGVVAVASAVARAVGKAAAEMEGEIPFTEDRAEGLQTLPEVIAGVGKQMPQLIEYIEKSLPLHLRTMTKSALAPESEVPSQSELLEKAAAESPRPILSGKTSGGESMDNETNGGLPAPQKELVDSGFDMEVLPGIPEDTNKAAAPPLELVNKDVEIPLDDVDDSVINAFLLSPEEKIAKALMWDELTKDIMPLIEERRRLRRRREEFPRTTRKRRPPPASGPDAVTAVKNVLMEGSTFRSKLNESALEELLGT